MKPLRMFMPLIAMMATILSVGPIAYAQNKYEVPLFLSASDPMRQGFLRIINRTLDEGGTVTLHAIDDSGRQFGPLDITIPKGGLPISGFAWEPAMHLNSNDLENGNLSKGIPRGIGAGQGDWRLELSTSLELEVLAYIRTYDGFLTKIDGVTDGRVFASSDVYVYRVPFFNPASNRNQVSRLRISNLQGRTQEIQINGIDDAGVFSTIFVGIEGFQSKTLSAQQLEIGGHGIRGALHDGSGKWQLELTAQSPIQVMSLIESPTGHLTNLTRNISRTAPSSMEDFRERVDGKRVRDTDNPNAPILQFSGTTVSQIQNGLTVLQGSYSYFSYGPYTGILGFMDNSSGIECTAFARFDTQTTGFASFVCSDGTGINQRWEMVD